jgi:predicted nucleic acid-binding protein
LGLIVLDTSVIIDNLRDRDGAGDVIDAALDAGHTLAASLLTKVELLAGMRSHERKGTREVMSSLRWMGVDDEIAELAGGYARRYRGSHRGIGVVDYVIAATAEHLGGELWTRNIKHFPMFPKLVPPY